MSHERQPVHFRTRHGILMRQYGAFSQRIRTHQRHNPQPRLTFPPLGVTYIEVLCVEINPLFPVSNEDTLLKPASIRLRGAGVTILVSRIPCILHALDNAHDVVGMRVVQCPLHRPVNHVVGRRDDVANVAYPVDCVPNSTKSPDLRHWPSLRDFTAATGSHPRCRGDHPLALTAGLSVWPGPIVVNPRAGRSSERGKSPEISAIGW